MHAANRAAWDEAAERYEGWFDEAVALIRSGGTNLFGVETELIGDLHGRCRRAIHLQCAGGRDTLSLWNQGAEEVGRHRLQPADARPRGASERGDRRAGPLDPVRRPRHAARARRHGRPRLHGARLADLAAGPRRVGGRDRPAPLTGRAGSSCSRAIPPSGCSMSTRTATGSPPTTTTSAAPRRRRAGRPSTSTGCRSPRPTSSWKFARAWTLGEVITALLGAGLRLERGRRAPDRLVGRSCRRPRTRSAAGSRCRSRWSAGKGDQEARLTRSDVPERLRRARPAEPAVRVAIDAGHRHDRRTG